MRGAFLLLMVLIVASEPSKAQRDTALDTVSIELKWYHQFQFAGYYAADIKGFYEEEGLHVDIIEGRPKLDYTKDIISGKTEFGIYNAGLLIDFTRGADVVALNPIFQYSPSILAAKADRNYLNLSDLANARIMVGEEIGAEIIKTIFIQQGINIDSIEFIQFNFERFKNDSTIDAINTYVTAEVPLLESQGIEIDVFYPWRYGVDFYGDILFTSGTYLKNNRSKVEAFQRATLKGWKYAREHEDEIINYILTLDGVNDRGYDFDRLKLEASLTWEYSIPDKIPIGFMSEPRWRTIAGYFQESGIINEEPDLKKFMIQPVQPLSVRVSQHLNVILPVLLISSGMIALWILTLRREVSSKTDELKKVFEDRVQVEKESKEHLLAAFQEKEVILAEVHHRVKNNMALITSLIELQRLEINNQNADSILKEAQLRIHTIADIHENLYDHESFMEIPFKSYVNQQIDNIFSYVEESTTNITVIREIDDLTLNINYSIPIALIINECLTNCLNHAFDGRDTGMITIHLSNKEENRVNLFIQDNGVGFKTNAESINSVGLTIIRALADQIEADLKIESSESGSKVVIAFSADQ